MLHLLTCLGALLPPSRAYPGKITDPGITDKWFEEFYTNPPCKCNERARRCTTICTTCGDCVNKNGGPAFDHKTTTATPSTIGAGRQLPSVVTMPDGFGRQQLQQQLFRATAPQGSPPPGEGGGGRGRGRARSTSRDIASHSRV